MKVRNAHELPEPLSWLYNKRPPRPTPAPIAAFFPVDKLDHFSLLLSSAAVSSRSSNSAMARLSGVSPARFALAVGGALPPAEALYNQMSLPKRMDENEKEKCSRVTRATKLVIQ